MNVNGEFLRTVQPRSRDGVRMRRELYITLRNFILRQLEAESEMTVNQLINKAQEEFGNAITDFTPWHVYQVKLDLEARGLIRNVRSKKNLKMTVITRIAKPKRTIMTDSQEADFWIQPSEVQVNMEIKEKFIELFKSEPLILNSPGRVNLIGEHTDYNNGFVMPAAINKGIQFAMAPAHGHQSIIYAVRYNQFFSIDHSSLAKVSSPAWANYLLGILYQLQSKGIIIKPFHCVFDGDLPLGAGLSSSAAMECGFIFGINELNHLQLSKLEMIHIAQWAEHHYAGVLCGIMDQFTCMMGKENHAMVLDCQWLTYDYFPLDLKSNCLLLCDTKVKHSLASSEYNTRRHECEEGLSIIKTKYPGLNSLRDVTIEKLWECKSLLPALIFDRCRYIIEENDRVIKASQDLMNGKLKSFGAKMFETHDGLSKLYEVSCAELDFLVAQARDFKGVLGSRMMGGGFGGCTINIIDQNLVGEFIHQVSRAYKAQFHFELDTYVVAISNGTSILENPFDHN